MLSDSCTRNRSRSQQLLAADTKVSGGLVQYRQRLDVDEKSVLDELESSSDNMFGSKSYRS